MGEGDVLVVDMGKKALGAGLTNPHEILEYLEKGVRVFNWPCLHAKVSPSVTVGTSSTGITGTQEPTRWRADGSSPWPLTAA